MEDKSILAQLKTAYESLQDIIDNADNTQLKSVVELYNAQNILGDKYIEVYNKIKKENNSSLYYDTDLLIADCISADYLTNSEDYDNQFMTAGDIGERWWEDYGFISSR